jgi:arsenate reductase (glutaredoxin)
LAVAEELGIEADVIHYLKTPPDRATLERLVDMLEDPVEDLVRKDAKFDKLGLRAEDFVGDKEAVVEVLLAHKELMQRPVVVKGGKALIGRPKDRVAPFLQA